MRTYIIRRLLLMIPTVLLVSILVFLLAHLLPGDIIDAMQAGSKDIALNRAALERSLGLDAPLHIQYGRWLGVVPQMDGNLSGVLQGNLGKSYWQRRPVTELLGSAWPVTLELGLMGLIISQLIALPIGVYSAIREDTWGDYVGRTIAILCISIPSFWLGTLIIVFPAIWWGYMPPLSVIPLIENPIGNLRMFIVPAMVLGMGVAGSVMRITRTQVLEVLRQDYIRTAWAKGLGERVVVIRHTLKNALIPVVSATGIAMPVLVGGTVIIEQIFCLPGMGRLIIGACLRRDELLICAITFVLAVALVLINLMVDLSYAYLDPRIRYK